MNALEPWTLSRRTHSCYIYWRKSGLNYTNDRLNVVFWDWRDSLSESTCYLSWQPELRPHMRSWVGYVLANPSTREWRQTDHCDLQAANLDPDSLKEPDSREWGWHLTSSSHLCKCTDVPTPHPYMMLPNVHIHIYSKMLSDSLTKYAGRPYIPSSSKADRSSPRRPEPGSMVVMCFWWEVHAQPFLFKF